MRNAAIIEEIRAVLPKDSIGRYDLLTVFAHKTLLDKIVATLAQDYRGKVDYVVAPEAIGWILGTTLAQELGVGFVGVRKGGRLPYAETELISTCFSDYSGEQKSFEIHRMSPVRGKRILIVDDWVETGSQMTALMDLLKQLGCTIVGLATVGIDTNEVTREWIETGFVAHIGTDI